MRKIIATLQNTSPQSARGEQRTRKKRKLATTTDLKGLSGHDPGGRWPWRDGCRSVATGRPTRTDCYWWQAKKHFSKLFCINEHNLAPPGLARARSCHRPRYGFPSRKGAGERGWSPRRSVKCSEQINLVVDSRRKSVELMPPESCRAEPRVKESARGKKSRTKQWEITMKIFH